MKGTEKVINSSRSLSEAQQQPAEEWRAVPGYEGKFEASSQGRVRSVARWTGTRGQNQFRWVKSHIVGKNNGGRGYHRVNVAKYGKGKQHEVVHRMVAKAFVPNPDNLPCVNHIDGCKTNNHPENLEWCTHQENMKHAFDNELTPRKCLLAGERSIAAKLTESQVRQIKRRLLAGEGNKAISRDYGVSPSTIAEIKAGRSWGSVPWK